MQIDRLSGTVLDCKAWSASTWSVVAWSAKAWRAPQYAKKYEEGHGSGRIAHLFCSSSTIASCRLASAGRHNMEHDMKHEKTHDAWLNNDASA